MKDEAELATNAIALAMVILQGYPSGGVGERGPTLEEMEEVWESCDVYDDDAGYDTCQHAWLVLHEALEDIKPTKGDDGNEK